MFDPCGKGKHPVIKVDGLINHHACLIITQTNFSTEIKVLHK